MRHSPSDNRLSLAEFLAWEAQARIAADSMIAQCVASGDTPGTETAHTFKAQIDRASARRGETPRRWVAFTVRTLCFISNRRNEQAKYELRDLGSKWMMRGTLSLDKKFAEAKRSPASCSNCDRDNE